MTCATRCATCSSNTRWTPKRTPLSVDLPNDLKKMVQIVKAVSLDPRILLLDEPTSSLTDTEVQVVLRLIRKLADDGVGVVLISHYLNEIFDVCDDLTVMRDGEVVADGPVAETSLAQVVTLMIGRHLESSSRGNRGLPLRKPANHRCGSRIWPLPAASAR